MNTLEIIGYVLFVISEIVAVLPIPANGFLHSFFIGLNNSIKNSNNDIEVAQQLVSTRPNTANLFNKIAINSEFSNTVKKISDNPDILPYIENDYNLEEIEKSIDTFIKLIQEKSISKRCREIAVEFFSLESGVKNYIAIYSNTLIGKTFSNL